MLPQETSRNSSDLEVDDEGSGVTSKRGKIQRWTEEEHARLERLVEHHHNAFGTVKWPLIAADLPGRTGKQARERWLNARPEVKKGAWQTEEENQIAHLHAQMGPAWSRMAKFLPNRPENAIKNHWNALSRCKTLSARPLSHLTCYIALIKVQWNPGKHALKMARALYDCLMTMSAEPGPEPPQLTAAVDIITASNVSPSSDVHELTSTMRRILSGYTAPPGTADASASASGEPYQDMQGATQLMQPMQDSTLPSWPTPHSAADVTAPLVGFGNDLLRGLSVGVNEAGVGRLSDTAAPAAVGLAAMAANAQPMTSTGRADDPGSGTDSCGPQAWALRTQMVGGDRMGVLPEGRVSDGTLGPVDGADAAGEAGAGEASGHAGSAPGLAGVLHNGWASSRSEMGAVGPGADGLSTFLAEWLKTESAPSGATGCVDLGPKSLATVPGPEIKEDVDGELVGRIDSLTRQLSLPPHLASAKVRGGPLPQSPSSPSALHPLLMRSGNRQFTRHHSLMREQAQNSALKAFERLHGSGEGGPPSMPVRLSIKRPSSHFSGSGAATWDDDNADSGSLTGTDQDVTTKRQNSLVGVERRGSGLAHESSLSQMASANAFNQCFQAGLKLHSLPNVQPLPGWDIPSSENTSGPHGPGSAPGWVAPYISDQAVTTLAQTRAEYASVGGDSGQDGLGTQQQGGTGGRRPFRIAAAAAQARPFGMPLLDALRTEGGSFGGALASNHQPTSRAVLDQDMAGSGHADVIEVWRQLLADGTTYDGQAPVHPPSSGDSRKTTTAPNSNEFHPTSTAPHPIPTGTSHTVAPPMGTSAFTFTFRDPGLPWATASSPRNGHSIRLGPSTGEPIARSRLRFASTSGTVNVIPAPMDEEPGDELLDQMLDRCAPEQDAEGEGQGEGEGQDQGERQGQGMFEGNQTMSQGTGPAVSQVRSQQAGAQASDGMEWDSPNFAAARGNVNSTTNNSSAREGGGGGASNMWRGPGQDRSCAEGGNAAAPGMPNPMSRTSREFPSQPQNASGGIGIGVGEGHNSSGVHAPSWHARTRLHLRAHPLDTSPTPAMPQSASIAVNFQRSGYSGYNTDLGSPSSSSWDVPTYLDTHGPSRNMQPHGPSRFATQRGVSGSGGGASGSGSARVSVDLPFGGSKGQLGSIPSGSHPLGPSSSGFHGASPRLRDSTTPVVSSHGVLMPSGNSGSHGGGTGSAGPGSLSGKTPVYSHMLRGTPQAASDDDRANEFAQALAMRYASQTAASHLAGDNSVEDLWSLLQQ